MTLLPEWAGPESGPAGMGVPEERLGTGFIPC